MRSAYIGATAIVTAVLGSSAVAADAGDLQRQVDALSRKVAELERALKRADAAASTQPPPDELKTKVSILERKVEIAEEDAARKAKETPVVRADEKGFSITSPKKDFQLRIRGLVHTDARVFLDDGGNPLDDTFVFRRVRPIIEGTLSEKVGFRIMPDFAGGRTVLTDAYTDIAFYPFAKVRIGKFKVPVGLERLQAAGDIRFIERGFPTAIAPNRDIGIQLSGDYKNGALGYEVGIFNGVADGASSDTIGDSDSHDSKDVALRLFGHPFQLTDIYPLYGLGFGIAASFGDETGDGTTTLLPSYRTAGQNTFFSYRSNTATGAAPNNATIASGDRLRISPQAYYYVGPLGILAEYITSEQDVRRTNGSRTRTGTMHNEAWQLQLSYLLTGEDNTFKSIRPDAPFTFGGPGWGAFELLARVGELDVDNEAFLRGADSFANPTTAASKATAWGIGANWYMTNQIRLELNYERTMFEGGGGGTLAAPLDREDEQALLARLQLSY